MPITPGKSPLRLEFCWLPPGWKLMSLLEPAAFQYLLRAEIARCGSRCCRY